MGVTMKTQESYGREREDTETTKQKRKNVEENKKNRE